MLVLWAVLCTAFTGQVWVTHLICELNPLAYIETAKAMNNCLVSFIVFTVFVFVFVLAIPAVAWRAIKNEAAGNPILSTQEHQNRSLSQEAPGEETPGQQTLLLP